MSKNNLRFTDSHEWIVLDGNQGTVGISQYAKEELGEIVALELPKVGQEIRAGEEVCVLESTKAAADVYAPVSGKIVAVNSKLVGNPHALNDRPEAEGWLFKVELSQLQEIDRLLSPSQYRTLIES